MENIHDISTGYCWCGCGQETDIYPKTISAKGIKAGEPKRFIRGHQIRHYHNCLVHEYVEEDRGYKTPCWIWQRKIANNGYGHVTVGGKTKLAHRYYYEKHKEPIPVGLSIDHLCGVRNCVNPDHLEAVPLHVNQRRGRHTVLREELVLALKEAHGCGVLLPTLETLTGIKGRTLRAAIYGENWSKP